MSYDLTVYAYKERLPSASDLRARLATNNVVIDETVELLKCQGFVPVTSGGAPSGFELYAREITDRDREAYRRLLARDGETSDRRLEALMDADVKLRFSCNARDPRELNTMRMIASSIAELARGWLEDPQTGQTAKS